MTKKEFAEWLVGMVELTKQLPDDYLSDWKCEAKKAFSLEEWDNIEKLIDAIWKYRTLNDEAFLRLKKALEEAGTSTKAK